MHFVTSRTNKSERDRNLLENYFNERAILASELKNFFLSENPSELCDRLKLIKQEKRAGNISDVINQERVAIFDILLEYKCTTPIQHKKIIINF